MHYMPDDTKKWQCHAALAVDAVLGTETASFRVYPHDNHGVYFVENVPFDQDRSQGSWHYTHLRTDTPWYEPWEPPPPPPPEDPPPGDEPPADEPPTDEPPADEPPADEPPADEPPADEPPTEPPAEGEGQQQVEPDPVTDPDQPQEPQP